MPIPNNTLLNTNARLQSNVIAWVFASCVPRLMSLASLAVCANPLCAALPPPYDSPTLAFEDRELRRLAQVRACVCMCLHVFACVKFGLHVFEIVARCVHETLCAYDGER